MLSCGAGVWSRPSPSPLCCSRPRASAWTRRRPSSTQPPTFFLCYFLCFCLRPASETTRVQFLFTNYLEFFRSSPVPCYGKQETRVVRPLMQHNVVDPILISLTSSFTLPPHQRPSGCHSAHRRPGGPPRRAQTPPEQGPRARKEGRE